MKKILKKSIMTMLALMMCIGFWGNNLTEVDAASSSYGAVKLQIQVNTKTNTWGAYVKLSVSQNKNSLGTGGDSIPVSKGFEKVATLNGTSWSSKNTSYIRVEFNNGVKRKSKVKYIKVTPSDFKNRKVKKVTFQNF